MNKGKKMLSSFVKAHRQATIFLEPLKVSFYHISFLVLFLVYFPANFIGLLARNTRLATLTFYHAHEFPRAISFVSHNYDTGKRDVFQKERRNLYIVDVAGTQKKFNWSAIFINCRMNFGIITALAFAYMLI